jgi:hypothetical protein
MRSTSFSAMRSIQRCRIMSAALVGEASSSYSEHMIAPCLPARNLPYWRRHLCPHRTAAMLPTPPFSVPVNAKALILRFVAHGAIEDRVYLL